jgi:multidrug efflux pump subunit AcrB
MILVFLVMFLFLQNWRATLIPALVVPIALAGSCLGLYLFGYSINVLSLFAMVVAIGILVDDAIVVVENVERIMREEGLNPGAPLSKRWVRSPALSSALPSSSSPCSFPWLSFRDRPAASIASSR